MGVPAGDALPAFLHSCVSSVEGEVKQYTVLNPKDKPWAGGAALVYACDVYNAPEFLKLVRL